VVEELLALERLPVKGVFENRLPSNREYVSLIECRSGTPQDRPARLQPLDFLTIFRKDNDEFEAL
jgi:hypothetical protein